MISSHEYVRKAIHLLNLVIPLSYWHIFPNKSNFLKILFWLTCLFLFIDVIRSKSPFIKTFFIKIFGKMLRNHEIKGKFTGATWVMIASLLTISLFPKNIAILSLIFMSLGDTFAALLGRKFGKVAFFNKTFEGFLGGLLPCIGGCPGSVIIQYPNDYAATPAPNRPGSTDCSPNTPGFYTYYYLTPGSITLP